MDTTQHQTTTMHITKTELADAMSHIFNQCHMLREAGQREYAGGDNAVGNFTRLALELDTTPEKVLWTYAMKHKDGIAAHIRGNTSQREPVRGRVADLIVYLCIFAAMDDWNNNQLTTNTTPHENTR
jgi:hypothetical protein